MRRFIALVCLLMAGAAMLAPQSADAYTRKTPSIRLSSQATSSGAKSSSVTIPAGTTNAVITFYFASTNNNQAPTSVSLDSQSATKKVSDETGGVMAIATYTVSSGLTTGASKTLAWTNGTGYTVLDVAVEFYDSTPTYGATDSDDCSSCGMLTTVSLSNISGDDILCAYGLNGAGSISSIGSGQSKLDETVGASTYGFTTKAGAGGTTTASFTETGGGLMGYNCLVITFSGSTPTFSAGPTYAMVSNTQISATLTATAGLTYYCALYAPGASAPTAAQVAAGTNAHSAVITGTTTGSSESHNITASDTPSFPKYDPYCVLYNGAYSAVPSTSTTATTAPTGFQYVTLASVTATGSEPKAFNDADLLTLGYDTQTANFTVGSVVVDSTSGAWGYVRRDIDMGSAGVLTIDKRSGTFADNDSLYDQLGGAALVNGSESAYIAAATSDTLVVPTTVSPSSATLSVTTSGQYSYTASGRQSALNGLIFHAATAAYFDLDLDAWFNNTAPNCQTATTAVVFRNGSTVDYDFTQLCGDDDNDSLSYARISALPHGLSLNASGHVTGTPDVDATTSTSFIVYDQAGDYASKSVSFTVQTQYTVPNCAGLTTGVCGNQILALTAGTVSLHYIYQCSATIASGSVIAQSPAAGATVAPGDTEVITSSVGNICSVRSPDCTSSATTLTACQTLYMTAFSNLVSFASTAKCHNTIAANDVISTFPRANVEIPANATVSMVYSLGTCSTTSKPMVNCIARTTAQCLTDLAMRFGTGVTLSSLAVNCPSGYQSGKISSQSPASGQKTFTPAVLSVRVCQ